jgi:hypothetical protein
MKPFVKELIKVIREATDDRYGLNMSMEYFVSILRVRHEKMPVVELMTVFRRQRPLLHRIMSKNIQEKNPVYFILDFEGDYETSLRSLEINEEMIRQYPLDH